MMFVVNESLESGGDRPRMMFVVNESLAAAGENFVRKGGADLLYEKRGAVCPFDERR